MGKRKYARNGEEFKGYECCNKKCKWQGLDEQKIEKKIEAGHYQIACPKCGNSDFYRLLEAPKAKESIIQDVITSLDSLNVGDKYKYHPNDVGIFKVIAKDEKNWIKTIRTQSGRIAGGFPWTKVYPINE